MGFQAKSRPFFLIKRVACKRKGLGIAQREVKNDYPENHSDEIRRAHSKTKRSIPRLD